MRQRTFLFFFFLLAITISGSAKKKNNNPVLLTIHGKKVTKNEFLRIYQKNNTNLLEDAVKNSVDDYLKLFIDFKLKVTEAENQGMDTAKAFIDELAGYRKELAKSYLTDISFQEEIVEEAYSHSITEVNASHILIMCKPDASPADTLKAWNKAMEARTKYLEGEKWDRVAIAYSEEPKIEQSKGNIGYFAGFQMVYPFEKAAFNAKIGEITMPVRSRFGYHLILVHDKRPELGQIKVAHIMKMFKPNMTGEQKAGLKDSIDRIYQKVQNGEDFARLAAKYSDDRRSAEKGGEMDWFDRHTFRVTDFSTPAYALKRNEDISGPIRTDYGWHIIKRLDFKPSPKMEEVREKLEKQVKDDPMRSKHSQDVFIAKLKKEYRFKEEPEAKKEFYQLAINFVKNKKWDELPDSIDLSNTLFTYEDQSVLQFDFMEYLKKDKKAESSSNYIDNAFNSFVSKKMLDYEDQNLERKYPEFKYLINEYHDGILLFNIADKMVWGKAAQDSIGLLDFYEATRDTLQKREDFIWGERFRGKIYRCSDVETMNRLEILLNENVCDEDILSAINADNSKSKLRIESGAWEEGANPVIDHFIHQGKKPKGEKVDLIKVVGGKIGPEPKTLEDSRGLYISEYQTYLGHLWLKELRAKYEVAVNNKVLKRIRKKESKLKKNK